MGKHNLWLGSSFYEVIQEKGAEVWSNLGTTASLPDGKSQGWHICSRGEGCSSFDSLPTPHQPHQPWRRLWLPSSLQRRGWCRGKWRETLQAVFVHRGRHKTDRGQAAEAPRRSSWSQQAHAHGYITESWNGWVGRDLEDHLVPTSCYRQRHLPLDQLSHIHI